MYGRNPPPPSSGFGIRVFIKPEYRITPPVFMGVFKNIRKSGAIKISQGDFLQPPFSRLGEIPRSNFNFDFEFERNYVLAEAGKGNPIGDGPPKVTESTSSYDSTADSIVNKYIAAGLNREAVPLAVANYGDNPTKIKEFANGYTRLLEMGFSSNNVAEVLLMYDNDMDKALAYFLNIAS